MLYPFTAPIDMNFDASSWSFGNILIFMYALIVQQGQGTLVRFLRNALNGFILDQCAE